MKPLRVKDVVSLIEQLAGEDRPARAASARTLDALPQGWFEDHLLPRRRVAPLVSRLAQTLLTDSDPLVKQLCAEVIAEVPVSSPAVVVALQECLLNPKPRTVVAAVYALGTLGEAAAAAIPTLLGTVAHPSIEVRWRVAWALDKMGASGRAVVDAIRPLIAEDHPTARGYAVSVFAKAADGDLVVLEELRPLLKDSDAFVRTEATKGLARARA
jgi:HEAT repeat protein